MKKFISNKYTLYGLGIILFLIIWFIISLIINENVLIFPNPINTFSYLFSSLGKSYIYKCIATSLLRMIIGFLGAFVLALIFGIIAGENENIENLFKPTMTVIKSIPTATITFLFLILIGAKSAPILIVMLISFPILYESVVGGFKNIDVGILNSLALERKPHLVKIIKVKLPLSMPHIIVGITSSFALSFKIEIMAEIVMGDTGLGLGSAILSAQRIDPTNMVPIFAYSLIAIIFMLIFSLINLIIKKKFNFQK